MNLKMSYFNYVKIIKIILVNKILLNTIYKVV